MTFRVLAFVAVLVPILTAVSIGTTQAATKNVDVPPVNAENSFYVSNKEPLQPNPLVKLPIGTIEPRGWLRTQLELQADGFVGHLTEISRWCRFDGNAWVSPEGKGHSGWEELPYWLKGYGDMGYVLGDKQIIKETRKWIEAALKNQADDGFLGPRANRKGRRTRGKPDMWPNMIMLNCFQSYYDFTGDERVLKVMTDYFKWQMTVPDEDFLVPFWQKMRASDNLESVIWLYNRTGDDWLLDLAKKIHRRTAPWSERVANWHGVNICQGFRAPAVYWIVAKDRKFLNAAERNYQTVMGLYGQVPGGMFGADENARKGYDGPRQAAETCSMVEFMHSFQMLTRFSGDPKFADRCEEVAFNSFPASLTPDLKGLHYLTAPNMVQLDRRNKAPGLQNGGCMLAYNPHGYRCCQHNVSHGWPYYAEHLWMATPDNGLAAVLYCAGEVTAKVGPAVADDRDGTEVTITEKTDYPFSDKIQFAVATPKSVEFPLYLRVPRWCEAPSLDINGRAADIKAKPLSYIVVTREWQDGDKVTLTLPMEIAVRKWEENHDSVSVDRGPLTYSLKIQEDIKRYGGTDEWPAVEYYPASPWNYGLVLDEDDPTSSFEVVKKSGRLAGQPFTIDAAPIELRAKGRRIPGWKQDPRGLVGKIQDSPIASEQPTQDITLIPMGCARLRISAFPVIGSGPEANKWKSPPTPPKCSHCCGTDTTTALNDGKIPKNSNDHSIRRMTWWDHKGTKEWVQYDYKKPRTISRAEVYWFDDTGAGQCRTPASWRLLWKDGDEWKEVTGAGDYGTARDQFNKVAFDTVETTAIRLEVQLKPNVSGGILEWRVKP